MSRLQAEWLKNLKQNIAAYEDDLRQKTGLDFPGIAARANGISRDVICKAAQRSSIAVVTVTAGKGEIGGFAESVAAILSQAGFRTRVMPQTDVQGLYSAYTAPDIDFVFLADDDTYMGLDLNRRRVSENSRATARGFVTVLEAMCPGGLLGKEVLVMGCGKVGTYATEDLLERGALPVLFDKSPAAQKLGEQMGLPLCLEREDIKHYFYLIDATNEGGWLTPDLLHEDAIIAAPGVPLSFTEASLAKHGDRLVHDLLHIGTLAMLGELCCGQITNKA